MKSPIFPSSQKQVTVRLFIAAIIIMLSACQLSTPTPTPLPSTSLPTLTATPALPTPTPTLQLTGKLLFISDQDGNPDIFIANADGSGLTNLTHHPANDLNPIWSPDGESIAFCSNRDGKGQIYLMRSDGTQVMPVPQTGLLDHPADWSPDGQYLLFTSTRDVGADIYAVRPDGTGLVNLTHYPTDDLFPRWSPDGTRIVFASDRDSPEGKHIFQIYLMNVNGGEVVKLTDFPNGASIPVWSPDGRSITVSVAREADNPANIDIYIMQADGGNPRQLTSGGLNFPTSWSPDGEWIAINWRYGSMQKSFLVPVDGQRIQEFAIGGWGHRWQPTGGTIPPITLNLPASGPEEPRPLALVNGTLIDGTGAEPVRDAVVIIQDGRIAAVGPRAAVTIPADAKIIDVQGGTILPGFINAHVHMSFDAHNLSTWARAGVTTVRDLAEPLDPAFFAFRDATLTHPHYARIVASGPIVTIPGGYPIPVYGPDSGLPVTSPEDARQKVAELLDSGADIVKIALGYLLTDDEIQAIVTLAHERGTIVTAHVGSVVGLEQAVKNGVDDAAHMVTDDIPDELIGEMITRDFYIVPTLSVINFGGVENLRRFVIAGGKVALGNDYGAPGGDELGMPIHEIELMQQAGMTPMQIIVAATKHAAHVCNRERDLGTLEVGKIADILVVSGDPLQDIHALLNVWMVIRDGVVIR